MDALVGPGGSKRLGQPIRVARLDDDPGLADDVRQGADAGRDDRDAGGKGIEGSQPGAGATIGRAVQSSLLGVGGSGAPRFEPRLTYLHGGPGFDTLDYFGPAFIGLILFFLVFVITTVAFLRERSQGTLERLMASPLRRGEIVLGYMLGFSLLALLQGLEVLLFSLYALHIHNSGQVWLIFGV